jgi:hypothetical protein
MVTFDSNTFWLIPDALSIAFLIWVLWMFWRDQKR